MKQVITEEEASEIYNALNGKRNRIRDGEYRGDPAADEAWAERLNQLMNKIGPDGACIVGLEFDGEEQDGEA